MIYSITWDSVKREHYVVCGHTMTLEGENIVVAKFRSDKKSHRWNAHPIDERWKPTITEAIDHYADFMMKSWNEKIMKVKNPNTLIKLRDSMTVSLQTLKESL